MSEEIEPQDLTIGADVGPVAPRPLDASVRPTPKVLLGLAMALVLAVGSFLLGRASPAEDPQRQSADESIAAVAPIGSVEASDPVEVLPVADAGGLPVAIKGTQLLAEVDFSDSSAAVICRQAESGGGNRRLSVAHFAQGAAEVSELLTLDEIAVVSSCDSCAVEPTDLDGEPVILGSCGDSSVLSGMPPERARNSQWVFVVAEPGNELETALAMRIHCGETSIEVDGDALVVTAQLSPGGDIVRSIELPPVRFTRQANWFVADDPAVLTHFCSVTEFDQLQGSPWRQRAPLTDLSFLERESAIGAIGFHGPVLVALTNQQCAQLFRVQRDAHRSAEPPEFPPLAAEVGWDPPEGFDDWFLTCRPGG